MFDLGIQELIVIFVVALLVFGPKRLPELGRTLGKGMLELRKAMEGVREQMRTESEITRESTGDTVPKNDNKKVASAEPGTEQTTGEISKEREEQDMQTKGVNESSDTQQFYRDDEKTDGERKEG